MASTQESPLLFSNRTEWSDVTPLPQYEGITPLAPIFYSEEYKDATDYFRGIVQSGELSERVLELTERIIRMNPAHYSAWQYRYKALMAIKWPLDKERELMDELSVKHLKNYQVWHHRRLLLTALRDSASTDPAALRKAAEYELVFIADGLKDDAKNYHTWSYRQWILAQTDDVQLWKGEIPWLESLLDEDVRNNSAWHHRFFVVWLSGVHLGDEDRDEVTRREIGFAKDKISIAPNNLSAWNYLRGVLDHTHTPYAQLRVFVEPYAVGREPGPIETPSEDNLDLDNPLPGEAAELPASAAIEFLAEILEQEGPDDKQKAVQLYRSLADRHDTIRKKYWELRIREALAA